MPCCAHAAVMNGVCGEHFAGLQEFHSLANSILLRGADLIAQGQSQDFCAVIVTEMRRHCLPSMPAELVHGHVLCFLLCAFAPGDAQSTPFLDPLLAALRLDAKFEATLRSVCHIGPFGPVLRLLPLDLPPALAPLRAMLDAEQKAFKERLRHK
jgi:hypothetical protein